MKNIIAGDTVILEFNNTSYTPELGYSAKLCLRGPSEIDIDYLPEGSGFKVVLTGTDTEDYTPGEYDYALIVYTLTSRATLERGKINIFQDISAVTGVYDTRSHAKKVLDAIESVLEGIANTDAQQMMLNGRQLTRFSHSDLLKFRAKYKEEYRQEQIKSGVIKSGGSFVRTAL